MTDVVRRYRPTVNFDLPNELKKKVLWFRPHLRRWFAENGRMFMWRKPDRTPYEILVAEILLRRARAQSVAKVYPLFLERFPDLTALMSADSESIEDVIKPLGLWRQRTTVLMTVAMSIQESNGQIPETREGLERLFHIGDYIASVILTTFHKKAEPFIDVNMARVVERFFGPRRFVDFRSDSYLHAVSRQIVKTKSDSLSLNWAVLDFAALVCMARAPQCDSCPFSSKCHYFNLPRATN